LLPQVSTDSPANFGDGNKTKTIAKLDQKIRPSLSQTVLSLTATFALPIVERRFTDAVFTAQIGCLRPVSAPI
jgi:hypothetical protein